MSFRSDLKDHIQAALGDGYVVYDAGEDVIKTPCVVLNPATPYVVPTSMALDATVQHFVDLWLVTNRIDVGAALDHLDKMRRTVGQAVKTNAPAGRWSSFGQLGSTDVGGTMYATGVMQTVFVLSDEQEGV